jgi:uncharacterized protein YcbK (DUF882 family)
MRFTGILKGFKATVLGRRPVHRSALRVASRLRQRGGALAKPGCEGERRLQRRRWGVLSCLIIVLALAAGTLTATANATRDRTISLYNIHSKETLTIQYMKGGKRLPDAMQKINWILRDWRKDEPTQMDPDLIDLLWEIHAELGSKEPIHIISGFRSRDTNNMLRRTVGGQASESRHILGKAADVHFPDIPIRQLRYSALIHERGGVGYYPTSAIPFVHIDTDRVRAWPRLPRTELALLFPSGRTQHIPDDGEPISKEDVRAARLKNVELASQIAQLHELRTHPRPLQLASLTPSLPQLLAPPRLIERPAALAPRPSEFDRARLAELSAEPRLAKARDGVQAAAADPQRPLAWGASLAHGSFVPAPAYDDEHPEELSYRPFPIAPLLTATASPDDPVLARMVHPDLMRALELLDQANASPPLRLRPGLQTAHLLWVQEFKGEAINLSALYDDGLPPGNAGLGKRKVVTSAR